jgi:hypothetical protein
VRTAALRTSIQRGFALLFDAAAGLLNVCRVSS